MYSDIRHVESHVLSRLVETDKRQFQTFMRVERYYVSLKTHVQLFHFVLHAALRIICSKKGLLTWRSNLRCRTLVALVLHTMLEGAKKRIEDYLTIVRLRTSYDVSVVQNSLQDM
jgi:hypothetical protein